MLRSPLARRLLLGVGLAMSGCATATPDPHVIMTEPPTRTFMDRVLRREATGAGQPVLAEGVGDPKDPAKLSLAYARLMEESGKLDEAKMHYSRALDENPESVDALVGLGRVHTLAGRHDQAEQTLLKALKHQPKSAKVLHGLAQSYAARSRWDEAAQLLREAAASDPADQTVQYDLAVALVQTDDIDAAMPYFVRTVGDAEAHYNVGLILQRAGRLPESEQQFRIALAKKPDFEQARQWLQKLHEQQTLPALPPGGVMTAALPATGTQATAVQPVGYSLPQGAVAPATTLPQAPVW
jgi:tetratricopeptide (TPR) repeat protein